MYNEKQLHKKLRTITKQISKLLTLNHHGTQCHWSCTLEEWGCFVEPCMLIHWCMIGVFSYPKLMLKNLLLHLVLEFADVNLLDAHRTLYLMVLSRNVHLPHLLIWPSSSLAYTYPTCHGHPYADGTSEERSLMVLSLLTDISILLPNKAWNYYEMKQIKHWHSLQQL